ncbi:hypothetical protein PR048_003338 [Dryococelus australis]|uniref:HTH CENPB-type domain-containing protein n=1 Tax=Dryococelus australis TaxID=614101 RepID=A0ABQ9IMQ6_9NEOP|nr:hypothetical protein PR048_003338 [Dryococelus australis]
MLTREEENILVRWISTVAKAGFQIAKTELLNSVQQIIKELNHKYPFVGTRPGQTWFLTFLNGHPNITSRMAQNLTSGRASVLEECLSRWFEEINNHLKENKYENILEQPERVFNIDESTLFPNPKGNKVLCVKGEKNVYEQVNADEKECLTVLVTGNANGDLSPTLVVFKYERKSRYLYLLSFSLMGMHLILPYILNLTHLIQPMDIAEFHVLKAWKKKAHLIEENPLCTFAGRNFNDCITPSILKYGFRKCGFLSWTPAAVDTYKIPTMDAGPAVTNRSSSEQLRAGKTFLEGYIGEGKLQSFLNSGVSQDNSPFLLWKKATFSIACKKIFKLMKVMAWIIQSKMVTTTMKKMKDYKQERAEARKAKQEEPKSAKNLKLQDKKKKIMGRKSKKISREVSDTDKEEN